MKYQDIEPYFDERVAVQFAAPIVLFDCGRDIVGMDSRTRVLSPLIEERATPQGKVQNLVSAPFLAVCIWRPVHPPRKKDQDASTGDAELDRNLQSAMASERSNEAVPLSGTGVAISFIGPSTARLELIVDAELILAITRIVEIPSKENASQLISKVEFREWLVRRVMDAAFQVQPGESLDALTKRLGIRPDVLVEAQQRKLAELHALGRPGKQGGARRRRVADGSVAVFLNLPTEVFEDLNALCLLKKVKRAHMVRAALNTLLLGPRNPHKVQERTCWYKGKPCILAGTKRVRWPYVIFTAVSQGAKIALQRRADALGCTISSLARCQIVDLLEGQISKLYFVNPSSMFGDPDKYWTTPELMRKEK